MKKYIHSIFDKISEVEILDVRPFHPDRVEITNIPNLRLCSRSEFNKLRSKGFSHPIGKQIMDRVYDLDISNSKRKPVVLIDQSKLLLAKTIWLQCQSEMDIYIYKGGYQGLIREANQFFKRELKYVMLCGKTGTGKTEILQSLKKKGAQVLNLERIARHKGSGFGNLEGRIQPNQDNFILSIAFELAGFDPDRTVYIESEKYSLGKNLLPLNLMETASNGRKIWLNPPKETRVQRIVEEYFGIQDEKIKQEIQQLRRKLGEEKSLTLIEQLKEKQYPMVAEGLLDYFDKGESYQMEDSSVYEEIITETNPEKIATILKTKYP